MRWCDSKFMAYDFETTGALPEYALQSWRKPQGLAWPSSLVWAYKSEQGLRDFGGLDPDLDMMVEMLTFAVENNLTICGWNTQFDVQWLLAYGLHDLVFKVRWLDGMLLWRHWFLEPEYDVDRPKKKSYRLKSAVAEHLPQFAGYEDDIDFHSTDPEERKKLHRYNIRDVLFTLRLTKKFYNLLAQHPQRLKAALIEAECIPMVAEANLAGQLVDTLVAKELRAKLTADADAALEELAPHGVSEKVVRSPMQLANLMYDDWGLPVYKENVGKKTGKTTRATDKEVLHELAFIDPRAKTLREYREALNNRTKFAETPIVSAEYNGDRRTHPQAIIFGTYSGRLTYSSTQGRLKAEKRQIGFALHQEKRDKMFRNILVAPPGYTLVEFDAAGQEFRWMAIASGDPTMLSLCMPGGDPHSYMGAQIADLRYEDLKVSVKAGDKHAGEQRQLGKLANLCVSGDTRVLTDRGCMPITEVRKNDLVWDGEEFVSHDGVVFSGVRPVITYAGLTATPDHKVLVDGKWVRLDEAKRYGRKIEPALGEGWPRVCRSGIRVMDGIVRRAVSEIHGSLCAGALRLRCGARREPAVLGDRAQHPVQSLRSAAATCAGRSSCGDEQSYGTAAKPGERLVSAVPQPQLAVLQKLWRAWDRVQVLVCSGRGRVYTEAPASPDVSPARHRQRGQRWALRAGQPEAGDAQGEPREQAVYDIVNCGPRTRFAANGLIVHNSLQYRTSARKLRVVARVQYNLPMELPQAQLIHKTYQITYEGVPAYWQKQISLTKQRGWVETLAGRRVEVKGNWTGRMGWSMGSTAINYRIQGTGADQKYLAMMLLRPYLHSIGASFAWDLHDGIYIYVPTDKLHEAVATIQPMLDNLPYKKAWGFTPPIPMPWDCKVGASWGDLKDYVAP